jgi:hypothetical protein
MSNHTLEKNYSYDKSKIMEENRKSYATKQEEKENTREKHNCTVNPGYIMGVAMNEIEFLYDSGTTSEVDGVNEKDILFNVEEKHILVGGVGGHKLMSVRPESSRIELGQYW